MAPKPEEDSSAIAFQTQKYGDEEIYHILNPLVKQWFEKKFTSFALPQQYGIIPIHSRKNILVSAPTGSGKTLTAFLAILNELVDSAQKGILTNKVYCVYCSPLKALNYDIQVNLIEPLKEMEAIYGDSLGVRVGVRTGDTSLKERAAMAKKPPHILITTPESLAILLTSRKFSLYLHDVAWCIIDEVHALAENKRGVHLSLSLEMLQQLSSHMTRIGLSATVHPLEEIAKCVVGLADPEQKIYRPCNIIDVQFLKKLEMKVIAPTKSLIDVEHWTLHNKMYEIMDALIQQHKTTLIFTNTRSATERVVHHLKEKFPQQYTENIGAHHGSLSAEHRRRIEQHLREGKLKVVVSSTSLELGIDIGSIDLVILLGSPKTVARALQRIGRSGHRLHDLTKGRIIVLDRDDLVECSVLLKSAIERKIDTIHIPANCLDVLAQQIYGIVITQWIKHEDLYLLIKRSYHYRNLSREDFQDVIDYLAGKYVSLEQRHIYAKIFVDEETRMIRKRGKLARMLYMTNVGTIPDEIAVTVKVGEQVVGSIEEAFLERLHRGDIFVLGGDTYQFLFARGMVAQVATSAGRPPTVPSWFSEMLPLSFDLAMDIGRFRRLMDEHFRKKESSTEILEFIKDYLYAEGNAAEAIYEYFLDQFQYAILPHDKRLVIEQYKDEQQKTYVVFHALWGRRVNDCLSRAIAYILSRLHHFDVEVGISDNGFYLTAKKPLKIKEALKILRSSKLDMLMELAIEHTEVLKRRFRHCATRSLMILRTYKGHTKRVGRQQVSSMILMSAVKRISPQFSVLKEARREVVEDLMDIANARKVVEAIEKGEITIHEISTNVPSPFAFMLVLQGYLDMVRIEDKQAFLRRMHQFVKAKIALKG
ncbi:ATP-dependent helicase [Candidatus Woesearchaeota archaeon]|nr:ATP-dependent helicase [Candidatus Woesearchaeota archaeon]